MTAPLRTERRPRLVVLVGGGHPPRTTAADAATALAVSRDERVAHTATIRQHLRAAMRALADGRVGLASTWLAELERLNEREAIRARAVTVETKPCPDGIERIGHGKAA